MLAIEASVCVAAAMTFTERRGGAPRCLRANTFAGGSFPSVAPSGRAMPPNPHQRSNLGYLGALLAGIVASAVVAVPLFSSKQPGGFLCFLLGPLLSVVIYSIARTSRRQSSAANGCERRLAMALAAFFIGPMLGAAGALIYLWVDDVHPLDRDWTLGAITCLGFIAGTIVAVAIAVSALFK